MLSQPDTVYYNRQVILPELGIAGQQKLSNSTVVVVGAGGLGCPALQYMAGAGVGTIKIVDGDNVKTENLHRQVLYTNNDIGKNKAQTAKLRLRKQNPNIRITAIREFLEEENGFKLLAKADVVVDATDNFKTRFLIGKITDQLNIPLVYAAILGFEGQLAVFNYSGGGSFDTLFPEFPNESAIPNCAKNGVIGVVPGFMGILQANEVIKIITGLGEVKSGKLLVYNLLTLEQNEFVFTKKLMEMKTNTPVNVAEDITMDEFLSNQRNYYVIDVREPYEFYDYNVGGLLIPLQQIPARLDEIITQKSIVVVCESGVRSSHAANFLKTKINHVNIFNLKGGLKQLKKTGMVG